MRKTITLALISLVASCGGTSVPVIVQDASSVLNDISTDQVEDSTIATDVNADASFATLLNNVRLENNGGAVVHNGQLDAAAQAHAQDMMDNDYFSHTGLNGSDLAERATLAGYDWRTIGENIARDFSTEADVMEGWTNSPGHHANNINPIFTEFGLGVAQDDSGSRWVLMLGAR